MRDINILFSSVGRRVELVNCFRSAKNKMNISGKLIGVDIDELAPALNFVDGYYIVPKLSDVNFIDTIIDICNKENISLIIPTIDTELMLYAKNKYKIESNTSAKVMVSDEKSISIMRNKVETCKVLSENGVDVPKVINYSDKEIKYPLFIKPLDGSSSISNFKINNTRELEFFYRYVKNPIVQEFADGDEYCVDVFCDFKSNLITVVPKLRLAHRAGEITKAKIIKDREIINIAKKIVEILKPIGEINFDCIKTKHGIKIIEINGRFAGGAPMSFKAGADSPQNLYKILSGEKISYNENYKDNFIVLRFDDCVFFDVKK